MTFTDEKEGQSWFYQVFLPRIDKSIKEEQILSNYTDGIVRGNLIEFKLAISDINKVLFQAIKYLSAMRLKGEPIPANILLVSLNSEKAYLFSSEDYLDNIEKVYSGAASKSNDGFVCDSAQKEIDYSTQMGQEEIVSILRTQKYTKVHIDENDIVGWATHFYASCPGARKSDFIGDYTGIYPVIGEIRKPNKFKEFIYPYKGEDNEKFRYLMDKLNDVLQKKNLGAYYTHPLYAEKSLFLVRMAISNVPKGNDYIILDRCAGTGNLELFLTEDELSHCIVSTIEYYEYKVLLQTLGDKVRHIIPPTEGKDTFQMGCVRGADALSKEYIDNPIIKQYVDNPHCSIILFENPPFADTTSIEHQKIGKSRSSNEWKNSFAVQEMKKEIKGTALNDLGNVFIWTGFKYYLRQETDSYIVYSPIKYWKIHHLIKKKFIQGFAFNRRHFHTNIDSCVTCIYWANATDEKLKQFYLKGYDIDLNNNSLGKEEQLLISKINTRFSEIYYDKRVFSDDIIGQGIVCSKDGTERISSTRERVVKKLNPNIIGYLVAHSSGFDNPDNMSSLLVAGRYDANGFYLRDDNFLEKLPMFAASRYITYARHWTERSRIMKSADGATKYLRDVSNGTLHTWLLKCLLFTVMEPQNHLLSFTGTDGRKYVNKLTLDTTTGETLASKEIASMMKGKKENEIIEQWGKVLCDAQKTKDYDKSIAYGLYQIRKELNTSHTEGDETIYDYPSLNGNIKVLAAMVKDYYNSEIVPVLFEYEFLK